MQKLNIASPLQMTQCDLSDLETAANGGFLDKQKKQ